MSTLTVSCNEIGALSLSFYQIKGAGRGVGSALLSRPELEAGVSAN